MKRFISGDSLKHRLHETLHSGDSLKHRLHETLHPADSSKHRLHETLHPQILRSIGCMKRFTRRFFEASAA